DIKPSNLLLRTDGVVKVSDLGLARIGWSGESEEEKRRLMGTADFVAPEQAINSKTVDARADIYSLSCTLFFLLTGRPPFDGDTVAKRLAKHQTAPVPDIRQFRKDCPAALADLAARMMAKRPEDRPKSAVELLAQLKRLGAGCQGDQKARGPLRNVAPASDTMVDEAVFQATIDDSSLSADGEVEVAAVAEEFDFGSLPPVDLNAAAPAAAVAPLATAAPGRAKQVAPQHHVPPRKQRQSQSRGQVETGNQQLLLGIGLTVAVLALIAVVGLGIFSFAKPLPESKPKIKSIEDGKGGQVIIVSE
ncbi:MAG: protein kinase, partial [Pirellulales bacterium]|nr:protein kinase [Pirellulales bacterium]